MLVLVELGVSLVLVTAVTAPVAAVAGAVLHLLLGLLSEFLLTVSEAAAVQIGALLALLIKFAHVSFEVRVSLRVEVALVVLLLHSST
jgi:hypothetical protein